MNRIRFIPLLIISFAIIGKCHRRRVMWQQRTNIGDAANWEGERIPCASDALLFPQKSYDLIKLSNFSMKEMILPKSGGFILDTQTSLSFREKDSKCRTAEIRAFKSVIVSPWLSSSNWQTTRSSGESTDYYSVNAATPHDERIPCDNDEIIFPINNSYVVDFQSIPLLMFESIAIDGRVMSPGEFRDFLFTSLVGQSSFKNFDNTQFIANDCQSAACVCHKRSESLRRQLCENEIPFCQPTPHCSDPVTALGHCCPVCGAVFQMKLNSLENFNLDAFKSNIEKAITVATSVTDRSAVVYHSSVTLGTGKEAKQPYLQLIIIDRYEYDEQSSRLMDHLRETVLSQIYKSQSKFYFISGTAYTPNASGHVFTFIFGSLFLVTLFMTLIYIVYYDDRHIPRLMAAIRNRRFMHQSDVIFARFDNVTSHANERATSDDDGSSSVVEVDLHFGTDQSIEDVNRAFNNPMFEAAAGESGIKEEQL